MSSWEKPAPSMLPSSIRECFELMDVEKANYPIALMARVLKVTRTGYYVWRSRRGVRQERSDRRFSFDMSVAWFFNQYDQTHGAPRLTAVLARNGIHVDKKTVAASLRRQGLRAVSSRMFRHPRSKDVKECVYEDSCNRQWDKGFLDKVWITDFTYLRCGQGWVYLVAVRDAHTKRVIGYAMGVSQVTGLVRQALNMAYTCRGRKPAGLVLHADRGCQFTSRELGEYAKKAGLTLSMGRTGVCWDNAMAESFWSTLKIEYYYRHAFRTREEVYEGVSGWIEGFYNRKRLHSSIGMMPPVEYELKMSQTAWKQAA